MSKEKPEGEVVNFHTKITLDLTAALAKRLGQEHEPHPDEMTEQQELDLFDELQWTGE